MSDTHISGGRFPEGLERSGILANFRLLDESIDMIPATGEIWLATLERTDPNSAAILRRMFTAQVAYSADNFLEDMPSVPADPAHGSDATLVGKQFGLYRVVSLLGRGGMGSVWLAERADGLFKVALKLVHTALVSRVTAERFAREREILASLSIPTSRACWMRASRTTASPIWRSSILSELRSQPTATIASWRSPNGSRCSNRSW